MTILRYFYGKFALAVICFATFFITSRHLNDWSFHTSSLVTPSHQHPCITHANVSDPFKARPYDSSCTSFPATSNILTVVKTGATESYSKIPTQLLTVLRCLPDFLLFSDMEQDIAGYHIRDSLDNVLSEAKKGNPDFDLYRRQQACVVDQQACSSEKKRDGKPEGWNLDKYKNVHIAEKTYQLRPNYDWYLFIDADTYVLWGNLVQWLGTLKDPFTKKYYLGSMTLINDFGFAHGGSGYILSQATMQGLAKDRFGIANQYDMKAKESCCGDYVMGLALKEISGAHVSQSWPTINGEKPHTIPYGSRQWCHPLQFEKSFYESNTAFDLALRFKDVYYEFVALKLAVRRDDWDNLSEDVLYLDLDHGERYTQQQKDRAKKPYQRFRVVAVELDAHKSFEHCRKLCDSVSNCFQFSYHNGACTYNKSFMLGKPTAKTDDEQEKWTSGWNIERIQAWVEKQGECKQPIWPNI
ncbi:glycosyltransferase family 31 protein [Hypoxylon trugodes]|uniref:glycosyltransferase family 31 protein n=1 Tax=Hypoxylon trugodes TaxID=326681 RepID=UPI0021A16F2E|nr:glycosyltransferase family 31 protein [Hypoxylon trugodes]KAI1389190.1 glycosyltransferase family 31 protein [Hypoxylon trugodes]